MLYVAYIKLQIFMVGVMRDLMLQKFIVVPTDGNTIVVGFCCHFSHVSTETFQEILKNLLCTCKLG
jgi:hypothetical protein